MNDITRFITGSEELKEFTGRAAKPCVAILGSFNSGKSTLLNCLLGEQISPVGIVPTTPCLLHFDYGDSFKARFTGTREKMTFHQWTHFHSFLAQLKSPGGRVDIEFPSPLLKKCRLVDTPGIDSIGGDSGLPAEQAAIRADKVIYLFHQRGIEELNRLFLHKLASIWKQKNLNDISFWLNCNLGLCDGTSLETTRAALREIFLSPVRVNTMNTSERANVEILRLFLEVELAGDTFRLASNNLKKIDGQLPERFKKVAGIKDDSLFLSEFWGVRETAHRILEAGRLLYSLPTVLKEMDMHFNRMNSANLGAGIKKPGGKPYRPKANGIRENKSALVDLISHLLNEKRLESFVDRAKLEEHLRRIEEERFTVVAGGGFSTGKSTFFNALLKEEILPAADGPTTASVTRITYGHRKKATVHIPLQVTLRIHDHIAGKAGLRREELVALERWLAAADSDIAHLEACVDGRFKRVDRREMVAMVNRVKELFAAGSIQRAAGSSAIPSTFRLLPVKGLKGNRVLEKVRITFKNPGTREFDLSEPSGVKAFRNAIGPDNAFRIEVVELQHPSDFLKLADFVDTPGLDWIQKHHYERTSQYIRQSDACLVFLNAKHILNHMDRENFQELFWPRTAGDFKEEGISGKEKEKFFFVINFADALTLSQRETVYNFVRKNLTSPVNAGSRAVNNPKIFMISALRGLAGEDGGMSAFLRSLEEGILRYRGRDFYLAKVDELFSTLECASQNVKDALTSGAPSYERKKDLRGAQDMLRESRRKLKDIRNTIYLAKPP